MTRTHLSRPVTRPVKYTPWTLDEGLSFVRCLQSPLAPLGYGIAMAGSVLIRGDSKTDLDIVVFPYSTAEQSYSAVQEAFDEFGMKRIFSMAAVQRFRLRQKSHDKKHVEIWMYEGHRIDVFFLS